MKKISLVAAAALLFAGVSLQAQGTKQDTTHAAKKAAVTHHAKKASAKQAGSPADSSAKKHTVAKKHSRAKKDTTAKKG